MSKCFNSVLPGFFSWEAIELAWLPPEVPALQPASLSASFRK